MWKSRGPDPAVALDGWSDSLRLRGLPASTEMGRSGCHSVAIRVASRIVFGSFARLFQRPIEGSPEGSLVDAAVLKEAVGSIPICGSDDNCDNMSSLQAVKRPSN